MVEIQEIQKPWVAATIINSRLKITRGKDLPTEGAQLDSLKDFLKNNLEQDEVSYFEQQ
jgi:hypothetical protein